MRLFFYLFDLEGVLRDPFKEGEEEAWIDKVFKIKAGYEKHSEAMKVCFLNLSDSQVL